MMKGFFVFVLILTATTFAAQAKSLELKKNTRSIFIQEQKDWTLGKDLFGMPFIYFSPQVNGQRSNISFTDTGADVALDTESIDQTQDVYKENKKKWAEKVGATVLSFLNLEVSINKHGHKIHKIGFAYDHEGLTYVERSAYIECRGKVIFSKSLRLQKNYQHEKEFEELLSTLDCGGV